MRRLCGLCLVWLLAVMLFCSAGAAGVHCRGLTATPVREPRATLEWLLSLPLWVEQALLGDPQVEPESPADESAILQQFLDQPFRQESAVRAPERGLEEPDLRDLIE